MDRRGFLRYGAFGAAWAVLPGPARWTRADLIRHSPKDFHAPPGGSFGGQQGLITFFLENRKELGLSEEQVAKLKSLRNAFRKASARISANLEEVEEEFDDLMQADEIKIDAAEAASKRIEALEHELRLEFAKAISEGKRTLTPRQLKMARELREQLRPRERT